MAALAGEYHSVVARAAAARAALGLPFLCSSAVLDALTEQPTQWVARLAPAQSHGWQIYADFLLSAGHTRVALATEPSVHWASGARILREYLAPRGCTVFELDMRAFAPTVMCDELADNPATALLLLVGNPEPAVSIVKSVRRDQRLAEIMIGAPAGQPEFVEWATLLGDDCAAIPFLRYVPERLNPLGVRVEATLREQLGEVPSFVAFEGYDTVTVLANVLRSRAWAGQALLIPGRAFQSTAPEGRSSFPAPWASAFGNGLGRQFKSLIEIRQSPNDFGSFTPSERARTSDRPDLSEPDAAFLNREECVGDPTICDSAGRIRECEVTPKQHFRIHKSPDRRARNEPAGRGPSEELL